MTDNGKGQLSRLTFSISENKKFSSKIRSHLDMTSRAMVRWFQMTNTANTPTYGSRSAGTNRLMRVEVLDGCDGTRQTVSIHKLIPCKSGIFGKMFGNNFNVFRAWGSDQWMTNISGSTRYSMELDGLTDAEKAIVHNESQIVLKG